MFSKQRVFKKFFHSSLKQVYQKEAGGNNSYRVVSLTEYSNSLTIIGE